jgi:hypothetical protein
MTKKQIVVDDISDQVDRRMSSAFHEAGHALAFITQGIGVTSIEMEVSDPDGEHVAVTTAVDHDGPYIGSSEHEVVVCFAGTVAEAAYLVGEGFSPSKDIDSTIFEMLEAGGHGDLESILAIDLDDRDNNACFTKAKDLISVYWTEISAIAERAYADGCLDGQTITTLYRACSTTEATKATIRERLTVQEPPAVGKRRQRSSPVSDGTSCSTPEAGPSL